MSADPLAAPANPWPELAIDDWIDTRDTLTLWLQVIGKVRLARTPVLKHWWNIPLYVTSRGLGTSLMPDRPGRGFSIDLDLVEHHLDITTTTGESSRMALEPMTVKDFHAEVMGRLDGLDLHTDIWTMPVELEDAIPFDEDETHRSYDAARVTDFWRTMVEVERVFDVFRARFVGKSSPVHLFWGALDLAVTRFSGRIAPPHPGGAPNCGPHVMHEAYSHEVSSAGYWPGCEGEGVFYSYAYPDPPGYRDQSPGPAAARWDDELGEFLLPYTAVRTAADPDAVLLEFLQATYDAAAVTAGWDPGLVREVDVRARASNRAERATRSALDALAEARTERHGPSA